MKTEKPNIWNRVPNSGEEMSFQGMQRIQFIGAREGEQLTYEKKLMVRANTLDIASQIAALCKGRLVSMGHHEIWVEGTIKGQDVLVEVDVERNTSMMYDDDEVVDPTVEEGILVNTRIATYTVTVTGPREAIMAIFRLVDSLYKKAQAAQLLWWYDGGARGPIYKKIYLPPLTTKLFPEFYPSLEGGPHQFIKNYLAAPESVLLMAGAPGTGKTTLLRHMIVEHKLVAHVVYDENLMTNDNLFQSFLMDKEADMLIIEDADAILTSRERDNNHLMSRFLNVSDGLIKLPNKKLIFTTNLNDFQKVDQALLRPGRCFAMLHTRALNLSEAQAASRVGKFPTPTERKEYTLADLFNQGKSSADVRKFGFAG